MNTTKIMRFMNLCLLSVALSVNAQKDIQVTEDLNATAPIVPMNVLTKGGQAVAHYLIVAVDHVDSRLSGPSVVAQQYQTGRYFSMSELIALGYTNRGSFTELSDAMSSAEYSVSVIPTPRGYYDVRVDLDYYDVNNKVALRGSGWLNIYRRWDGTLEVGKFEPYVSINSSVAVRFAKYIPAAKWIPSNGSTPIDLVVRWDGSESLVIVPGQAFQDGFLAVTDEQGNATAWDLKSGEEIVGKRIVALLGQSHSGDFYPIFNTINTIGVSAYRYNGQIFGHVPLTEAVLDSSIKDMYSLGVKVWGSESVIYPDAVYVTPIFIDGGNGALQIGTEYTVPSAGNGNWFFALPKGKYHIRMMFPDITDWSSGGGGVG